MEVGGNVSRRRRSGRFSAAPAVRSARLLSSSLHSAGPLGSELRFPGIWFSAAPRTARSAWQRASGGGTSGRDARRLSTEPGGCRRVPAVLPALRVRRRLRGLCVPFLGACPSQLPRLGK